jgi:hypothetical protein
MYYKILLRVDKKYTRNFDALEMNSRKLWQKVKNISLKKKENTISQKTEVYVSKKLQKIQKVGYVLL